MFRCAAGQCLICTAMMMGVTPHPILPPRGGGGGGGAGPSFRFQSHWWINFNNAPNKPFGLRGRTRHRIPAALLLT